MKTINPKIWLLLLLTVLLATMLVIVRNYNSENELQEKIYDHSEIKDTI